MKIIIITILLSSFLQAQERLNNFIYEVLTQSPLLKSSENKYLAKEHLAYQAGILPDPVIGYTRWIEPVETRVGPQQNIFSMTQKIPFPGKLSLNEEIIQAEADQNKQQYEAIRRDLIYSVKNGWYDLYLVDQSLVVLQDYHVLLKDFVEAAAAKYATGQGIQAQVLKAQVENSTIQSRIQELQRQRYAIQSRLNYLRNTEVPTEIEMVNHIDSSFVDLSNLQKDDDYYKERQEYQEAQLARRQAELKSNLAYKMWYPDFTIQANYITVADKNSLATDAGKDAWGVMISVNLPLWFSERIARIEQSRKEVNVKQYFEDNVKNQIRSEIDDFRFRENSTRETIYLYKDVLIPQAESSLKSSLAAYRSGSLGFLELLDAERMLLQLRLTFLNEQVNYRKIIAGLERAMGGELKI